VQALVIIVFFVQQHASARFFLPCCPGFSRVIPCHPVRIPGRSGGRAGSRSGWSGEPAGSGGLAGR
jgi:hypothetical protein